MKNIFAKNLLSVCVLLASTLPSHAVMIHPSIGLDASIKEADTIAIVSLESGGPGVADGWIHPYCYVYQSLKGALKSGQRLQIALNEFVGTRSNFSGNFLAPMSTHLVFLRKEKEPINGARYTIITRKGADLPLSPLGNETRPKGKNTKEQIQTLVRRYKKYRDEQLKREDEALDKLLAE